MTKHSVKHNSKRQNKQSRGGQPASTGSDNLPGSGRGVRSTLKKILQCQVNKSKNGLAHRFVDWQRISSKGFHPEPHFLNLNPNVPNGTWNFTFSFLNLAYITSKCQVYKYKGNRINRISHQHSQNTNPNEHEITTICTRTDDGCKTGCVQSRKER